MTYEPAKVTIDLEEYKDLLSPVETLKAHNTTEEVVLLKKTVHCFIHNHDSMTLEEIGGALRRDGIFLSVSSMNMYSGLNAWEGIFVKKITTDGPAKEARDPGGR